MDLNYDTIIEMLDSYIENDASNDDSSEAQNRKRARLIEVATGLFIRHGYRKTSMDEVARTAGVAKGTVYLYFKTKADLLFQAIAQEEKKFIFRVKPVFDPALSPKNRLRKFIQVCIELGNEMPLSSKLLSGDHEVRFVLEDMDSNLRDDIQNRQLMLISELLKQAIGPDVVDEQTLHERSHVLASQMYSGVFFSELIAKRLPIERYAAVLADMLVDGSTHHPAGED